MDLHLYIPALIVLGAAVIAFAGGCLSVLWNFSDSPSATKELGVAFGTMMVYASPMAALVAVGMQIAHWA